MSLTRGTVVLVDLEPTRGHEQQGTRPCVVVSDAAVNSNQRFPLIAVVPVTATPAPGALYPMLEPGTSGLSKPSTALVVRCAPSISNASARVTARCPRRCWRPSTMNSDSI
ncbi:type II toxin-antitoxin system PemK/MazF family toxin [Vulcanococcus sp.]|uniref:type II toxin-antitoxin system PemK/MazF family toxin n=1 Tax=Vulcanococcus sp. TaxID=2856995 RepID=UPI003F69E138